MPQIQNDKDETSKTMSQIKLNPLQVSSVTGSRLTHIVDVAKRKVNNAIALRRNLSLKAMFQGTSLPQPCVYTTALKILLTTENKMFSSKYSRETHVFLIMTTMLNSQDLLNKYFLNETNNLKEKVKHPFICWNITAKMTASFTER